MTSSRKIASGPAFEEGSCRDRRLAHPAKEPVAVRCDSARVPSLFDRRSGAELARAEGPYNANRTVSINHMTPNLYHVDEYFVQARIFLNG